MRVIRLSARCLLRHIGKFPLTASKLQSLPRRGRVPSEARRVGRTTSRALIPTRRATRATLPSGEGWSKLHIRVTRSSLRAPAALDGALQRATDIRIFHVDRSSRTHRDLIVPDALHGELQV